MRRRGGSAFEVVYDERRWRVLREKREKAERIMRALLPTYSSLVHGSVARGDVEEGSDVDVAVTVPPNPAIVELLLERAGFKVAKREIVQATPAHVPKVYLYLDWREEQVVSYPLAPLRPREREFYRWGGECSLEDLEKGRRVPGVDKRLMLIEPTELGHRESPVEGREDYVAKVLGVSPATVRERVRVLTRRREHGRTGVFLKVELGEESVEEAIDRLSAQNAAFRRIVRRI
ncbi:MAG: nucleotidyltransferase domain-containing protein [Acidilobaceae archaeon]|nr:nucleotidyltransferase domain-containing protein [Acidilobaceae archaeon]